MACTVLAVDDEAPVLRLIAVLLKNAGYTVRCAQDADEAMLVLDDSRVDLAIIDINLPGMNGIDLTAAIARRPGYAALPVVLISAYREPPRHTARAFLGKPFEIDDLVALVDRLAPAPEPD